MNLSGWLVFGIVAIAALFVGYCLLRLLARFFEWSEWMQYPADERAALRTIERQERGPAREAEAEKMIREAMQ